ncbi:MAG: hypothetical protein EOO30_14120 [Comamonadaceae bacterium]|nr:MAG: hypothetical protein EOO30_14120 [Comamonadaceae bacterium]
MQQNASLVEEATAATESMKEQAGSLLRTVSRFRLGGESAQAAVPPAIVPIRFQRTPLPAGPALLEKRGDDGPPPGEWRTF